MTPFQKALKLYTQGVIHAQRHVGFRKSDVGDSYMAEKHLDGKRNLARNLNHKKTRKPKGGKLCVSR